MLPSCYQEKIRPEKICFKINEIQCIASIYFFLYNLQFTLFIVKEFTNLEINMTGEFLLFKKNSAIKGYSMRVLKISKELKRLSKDVHKLRKQENNLCQILYQINS